MISRDGVPVFIDWMAFPLMNTGIVLLFTPLLILIFTHLKTSLRFNLDVRLKAEDRRGREPPGLPYWVPWLGNSMRLSHLHSLFQEVS